LKMGKRMTTDRNVGTQLVNHHDDPLVLLRAGTKYHSLGKSGSYAWTRTIVWIFRITKSRSWENFSDAGTAGKKLLLNNNRIRQKWPTSWKRSIPEPGMAHFLTNNEMQEPGADLDVTGRLQQTGVSVAAEQSGGPRKTLPRLYPVAFPHGPAS